MTRTTEETTADYSTFDAAVLAGVTVRQLTHWAASGYLRPLRTGKGDSSGSRLRWDVQDIEAAARFGALSAALGSGHHVLRVFSQALAIPHEDAVGVMLQEGRFTVTIEVRSAK